jgi:acyl-CoA synthetase (AMP-forming)/AMP-acid ligase II
LASSAASSIAAAAVREELKRRVPNYMVPAKVLALESLPLSSSGKVDRHVLRGLLERGLATA